MLQLKLKKKLLFQIHALIRFNNSRKNAYNSIHSSFNYIKYAQAQIIFVFIWFVVNFISCQIHFALLKTNCKVKYKMFYCKLICFVRTYLLFTTIIIAVSPCDWRNDTSPVQRGTSKCPHPSFLRKHLLVTES